VTREDLQRALADANVAAFLRTIREGESSQEPIAYRMRYGGVGKPPAFFDDLSQHPRIFEPTPSGQKSSAAGAYQATFTTWNEEQRKYGWQDFSEQSQDEFAVARIVYRGALESVIAGHFDEACAKCRLEWTSLPGGAEANRATSRARQTYLKWGGRLGEVQEPAPKPEGTIMAPLIALIPTILEGLSSLIPALSNLGFGSGSEVAKRNVAAGQIVADKLIEVTKAVNLQEAAEKIQQDPQILSDARQVVTQVVIDMGLMEVAGGIGQARKDAMSADGDWRKVVFSFPFLLGAMLIPLIYAVVIAALLKVEWLATFTDDARMMVITAVINLALGSLIGYAYGTTIGSQKKDALLAR
jgi:muramidase (phage lysozyme)